MASIDGFKAVISLAGIAGTGRPVSAMCNLASQCHAWYCH